jgi:SSS family solute:Na+ symporter
MLSYWDYGLIFAYFILVFVYGIWVSRKKKDSSEDYFLAGRNVGWIAIGTSLFATNISSEHFIGLAGTGASSGLAVGHFEWQASFIVLLLGWVFAPFYIRTGVFTMPEFLEKRYNSTARWYLTSISIVAYIVTKISVALWAGGFLLNELVGWDITTSAVVLVLATGVYTVLGGLRAVIYTEVIQAVVLVLGAVLITAIGLWEIGGIEGLRAKVPADYFSMFKSVDDPRYPWTGVIFGHLFILGIWYWCTDQYIVQRVLSAKNIEEARTGTIFAGLLKVLPVFILILPGVIAYGLYGVQGDQAYPTLIENLLPVGVKGIVIASMLAALMATLASCFNSTSTLFTIDVYRKLKPQATAKQEVFVGRIATVVMVVLGILWIPFVKDLSDEIFIYLQSVQSYVAPPIAAVFLLGVLWPRINGAGAIATLFTGLAMGGSRFAVELMHKSSKFTSPFMVEWAEMNFLHYSILMFVVCIAVLIGVSFLTRKPDHSKVAGLTFRYAKEVQVDPTFLQSSPGRHRLNQILSVVLVLLLLTLFAIFF